MTDPDEYAPDYWERIRPHTLREGVGQHAALFERREGNATLEVGVFPSSETDGRVQVVSVGPRGGKFVEMSARDVEAARAWARRQRELVYQVERACNILERGSPEPKLFADADPGA